MNAAGDDTVPLAPLAPTLIRGVGRALRDLGYFSLSEFTLRSRRRVDVIALNQTGAFAIVEVKSTVEDFRADRKWRDYRAYCDRFYFAVPMDFPAQVLPEDCGLWIADAYGATLRREAPLLPINAARRRSQILRFAQTAAQRLARYRDPPPRR
ncbi:MAG TPA: MmcB family DNA repair protein [Kiloniellales bacterium]